MTQHVYLSWRWCHATHHSVATVTLLRVCGHRKGLHAHLLGFSSSNLAVLTCFLFSLNLIMETILLIYITFQKLDNCHMWEIS